MCGYVCIGFINFLFGGKTLIDYTSLFLPYDFEKKKMMTQSSIILRMNELISLKHITLNKFVDLCDQTKFRISEINEIKGYFSSEIWGGKYRVKNLVNELLLLVILKRP